MRTFVCWNLGHLWLTQVICIANTRFVYLIHHCHSLITCRGSYGVYFSKMRCTGPFHFPHMDPNKDAATSNQLPIDNQSQSIMSFFGLELSEVCHSGTKSGPTLKAFGARTPCLLLLSARPFHLSHMDLWECTYIMNLYFICTLQTNTGFHKL